MKNKWNIGNFSKGKQLPTEHRLKISLTMRQLYKAGQLNLPSNKGKQPWNKGIPRTLEERTKISLSKKGVVPWNKGIKRTAEEKEKMRLGAKKIWERRKNKVSMNLL